jgi:DNA-binding PadR family transcriptional regulator
MSPKRRQPLTIEHALLGFLRERPRHGYEIHQRLANPAGLGGVWRLKQSQLYALLGRLEAEGYVAATLEPQETRPARKVFRLTPAGRRAYQAWVRAAVPHGRDFRVEFLAKLFFARREGPAQAAALIDAQREACRAWLEAQSAQARALKKTQPYGWLVAEFRLGQIRAMLDWLDVCEASSSEPVPAEPPSASLRR